MATLADHGGWVTRIEVRKWFGLTPEQVAAPDAPPPDEVVVREGNALMVPGITFIWSGIRGDSQTKFSNANARLGIGDGTTAPDPAQTDLQGTNKTFKAMDATFPTISGATITFRATFGPTEANHGWDEFCATNAATAATGTMLNRGVQDLGTKDGGTWQATMTITLS